MRHCLIFSAVIIFINLTGIAHAQLPHQLPEIQAVKDGSAAIKAFIAAGGKFTNQQNEYGETAALVAVQESPETLEAFIEAGGTFSEDWYGDKAAVNVVSGPKGSRHYDECAKMVEIFARGGGKFTNQAGQENEEAAIQVLKNPKCVPAYIKAGGHFSNQKTSDGYTEAMSAISCGPESIKAFSNAGGQFTSHQFDNETDAERAARDGAETLAAYNEAVQKQGGLIYILEDDEFTALRNPEAINAFVKAGGHFDSKPDKNGETAEMKAIYRGPEIIKAFVAAGGKFTTLQDSNGETSASFAAENDPSYGVGLLAAYNEAVKQQGGLITPIPQDEYDAARNGAPGIEAFIKSGGKFTDNPTENGMTSAMIAVTRGADAINAFAKAGGHFTDQQNKDGFTAAMAALLYDADAVRAFTKAGGHFTQQKNHDDITAALFAVGAPYSTAPISENSLDFPENTLRHTGDPKWDDLTYRQKARADIIKAFADGGGHFGSEQDKWGNTAAILVVMDRNPLAVEAFSLAGGKFTDQANKHGDTAAMVVAGSGPIMIKAFAKVGGKFTDQQNESGMTSAMNVTSDDSTQSDDTFEVAESIKAFSEAGGTFTDQKNKDGWTAEMLAKNLSDYMKIKLEKDDTKEDREDKEFLLSLGVNEKLEARLKQRDAIAAKAYTQAIIQQGGVRHVQ